MVPVTVLDEWIVAADAALALQLQATPLVVLIAVGAVLIGATVMSAGAAALLASKVPLLGDVAPIVTGSRGRHARGELLLPLATQRQHPGGAQGARAPGRATPRPAPQA